MKSRRRRQHRPQTQHRPSVDPKPTALRPQTSLRVRPRADPGVDRNWPPIAADLADFQTPHTGGLLFGALCGLTDHKLSTVGLDDLGALCGLRKHRRSTHAARPSARPIIRPRRARQWPPRRVCPPRCFGCNILWKRGASTVRKGGGGEHRRRSTCMGWNRLDVPRPHADVVSG